MHSLLANSQLLVMLDHNQFQCQSKSKFTISIATVLVVSYHAKVEVQYHASREEYLDARTH